jgi:hypothetical protein
MKYAASYTRKMYHIQFMECDMFIPALKKKIHKNKIKNKIL